jgi:hypothetical protein
MCLLSRFFTKEKDPKVPPRNPPSGTVVDDVVTLPERYDFYVISQSVRQVRKFKILTVLHFCRGGFFHFDADPDLTFHDDRSGTSSRFDVDPYSASSMRIRFIIKAIAWSVSRTTKER